MTSEALGKEIRKQITEHGMASIPWTLTDEAFDHIRYNKITYIEIWAKQRNWSLTTDQKAQAYIFKQVQG